VGLAEVVSQWPDCVGPAIAGNAWPARIARDGTLHVSTSDAVWAFELGYRSAEIAARLGVPGIRFAPGPIPDADSEREAEPAPQPTAEQEARAASLVAPIDHPDVRESVQKAALFSLVRAAADPSN
jgi:hypothetical protein